MATLENWHERNDELVIFPDLNQLTIHQCPKLNTVPLHVPLLEKLDIRHSNKIKLRNISNLPMLSYLNIIADTPPPADPNVFRPPKTLKVMAINGFENVSPLEEDEKENSQENSLHQLTITNSNCFFSRGQTKLALGFWKQFKALNFLHIAKCNALVHWPHEEFKSLNCLKTLNIFDCKSFIGSLLVSSSSLTPCGEDSLPQLETLSLIYCPELVEVHGCYSSLKKLDITDCTKLSEEGLVGLTNLSELKDLRLRDCPNLRALPDNMGHLPSLERLLIEDCPGIESFPKGLQEHLPSLQSLRIYDCPALARLCRRGGDYWHLVSPIPRTYLWEEDNTRESTLRRFVSVLSKPWNIIASFTLNHDENSRNSGTVNLLTGTLSVRMVQWHSYDGLATKQGPLMMHRSR